MEDVKIILFLCNWGPHTAFQTLQDIGSEIPDQVSMIRIPCTGRISKSLLFKAFEMGADGVLLLGCKPGTCRYGSGTATARENTEDTRNIIGLLGLGKERLRHVTFLPDESDLLLKFLNDFCNQIRSLGPSPMAPIRMPESEIVSRESLAEIVSCHDAFACQDCGKCASACPLALIGKPFSPRELVNSIIAGDIDSPSVNRETTTIITRTVSTMSMTIRNFFRFNGKTSQNSLSYRNMTTHIS